MIVKELDSQVRGGKACLVKIGDKHYFVSSIPAAPDHGGPETLAFACDDNGVVEDWADLAGGRGMSREETISQLEEGENRYGSNVTDPLSAIAVALRGPGPGYYKEDR